MAQIHVLGLTPASSRISVGVTKRRVDRAALGSNLSRAGSAAHRLARPRPSRWSAPTDRRDVGVKAQYSPMTSIRERVEQHAGGVQAGGLRHATGDGGERPSTPPRASSTTTTATTAVRGATSHTWTTTPAQHPNLGSTRSRLDRSVRQEPSVASPRQLARTTPTCSGTTQHELGRDERPGGGCTSTARRGTPLRGC